MSPQQVAVRLRRGALITPATGRLAALLRRGVRLDELRLQPLDSTTEQRDVLVCHAELREVTEEGDQHDHVVDREADDRLVPHQRNVQGRTEDSTTWTRQTVTPSAVRRRVESEVVRTGRPLPLHACRDRAARWSGVRATEGRDGRNHAVAEDWSKECPTSGSDPEPGSRTAPSSDGEQLRESEAGAEVGAEQSRVRRELLGRTVNAPDIAVRLASATSAPLAKGRRPGTRSSSSSWTPSRVFKDRAQLGQEARCADAGDTTRQPAGTVGRRRVYLAAPASFL